MIDVQRYFFEYLDELVEIHYQEQESVKASIDLNYLLPTPNLPFQFFKWFFCHQPESPKKQHVFHQGGQKLFVDFFNEIHKVLFKGMDSVLTNTYIDDKIHVIKYVHQDELNNQIINEERFHFDNLLESLLNKELDRALIQIKGNIRVKDDPQEIRRSLIYLYDNIESLQRVTYSHSIELDVLLDTYFELYKSKLQQFILDKTPNNTAGDHKQLPPAQRRMIILDLAYKGLKVNGQRVFEPRWTSFDNLKELFINKNTKSQVRFNCSLAALAYSFDIIFEKLFDKKIQPEPFCNERCLWFMHDENFKVVSKVGSFYTAKSRIKDYEELSINDFFRDL